MILVGVLFLVVGCCFWWGILFIFPAGPCEVSVGLWGGLLQGPRCRSSISSSSGFVWSSYEFVSVGGIHCDFAAMNLDSCSLRSLESGKTDTRSLRSLVSVLPPSFVHVHGVFTRDFVTKIEREKNFHGSILLTKSLFFFFWFFSFSFKALWAVKRKRKEHDERSEE